MRKFGETAEDVPTKPTEPGFDGFVGSSSGISQKIEDEPMESVLKGKAVELCFQGEQFWLVADEEDAVKLGEPRGTVYTAAEARRVIQIRDPESVAEIHELKRRFGGILR